ALARALVRDPDVMLLDEPLGNLDAQQRVAMRAELDRFHREVGATMLFVTRDQTEALTLGERVAVVQEGALQQVGTPDEVYRRPVNRFVASFIGSPPMNLLPATVDGGVLRAGPFVIPLPGSMQRLAGRALELGIRPEDLEVSLTATGAPARVEAVEVAGPEAYLRCTASGLPLVARVGHDVRPSAGGIVHVDFERERAYLFDVLTGRTLVYAD
ncbi:MAG TPA: TOBE domain-containing protein, partial [Actinomycetota bacterium]|nr:TOBE domain-containing protein [Actinomycetota bacterium]